MPIAFALTLAALSPALAQDQEPTAAPQDDSPSSLFEACTQTPNLRTLTVMLEIAGLDGLLESGGPYTLFAPTDQAFAKLPTGFLRQLLDGDNIAGLRAILTYHVVSAALSSDDLRQVSALRTLNSQHLDIEAFPAGFTIDTATRVIDRDIVASNGVIHTIDTVLMPSTKTLLQTLRADRQFSIIVDLIETADLEELFKDRTQSLTFFAPTNNAIRDLSVDLPEVLSERRNRSALRQIIRLHMVEGVHSSAALIQASPVVSVGESMIATSRSTNRGLLVNGASINQSNIDAVGGIVHAVEGLFLPDDLKLRVNGTLQIGVVIEEASKSLRRRLEVKEAQRVNSTSGNARRAGLRRGDVILGIDGWEADEIDEAKREKGYLGRLNMTIYRDGEIIELIVPVGRSN